VWPVGSKQTIRWDYSGDALNDSSHVTIFLLRSGRSGAGEDIEEIGEYIGGTIATNRQFPWIVASACESCRIRIQVTASPIEYGAEYGKGISDSFSILPKIGYELVEHDSRPIEGRVPLILIHGFCGGSDTWDSFREFFNAGSLAHMFKLFQFNYETGELYGSFSGGLPIICQKGLSPDHTVARIQGLAGVLQRLISEQEFPRPDGVREKIGPSRNIIILAHSLGGLIARSFMQELGGHQRVLRLITLATPHHGVFIANNVETFEIAFGRGQLSSLYWDGYDGA
jgi:triacylglycerol esterase/lipase EstA (alpha/beta hydrolase family)